MTAIFISTGDGTDKRSLNILYICLTVGIAILSVIALMSGFQVMSAQAATIKVGMIFDQLIYDNGWNWLNYQGLLRAESELDVLGSVYTATDPSDYQPLMQQCVSDENDLCIGVGYQFSEAISNSAAIYTTTYFAIVDTGFVTYSPNLRGILFASEEVGYLTGALAGLMSKTDIIGDLGGMEIPPVVAFTEGYRRGAECTNPDVTTIISYTNDFGNPDLGAQYAQGMIAQGADVIFAAAGQTGSGAILTATQTGVWGIGVDTDFYYSVYMSGTISGSDYLLTSAMKRFDNAIFYTISDVVSGTFTSGGITYDLSQGGVDLAPFHDTDPYIPQSVRDKLEWVRKEIIADRIDPFGPCLKFQSYLPFTRR